MRTDAEPRGELLAELSRLRQAVPEITDVVDVTDHASGTNPYYEAAKK